MSLWCEIEMKCSITSFPRGGEGNYIEWLFSLLSNNGRKSRRCIYECEKTYKEAEKYGEKVYIYSFNGI